MKSSKSKSTKAKKLTKSELKKAVGGARMSGTWCFYSSVATTMNAAKTAAPTATVVTPTTGTTGTTGSGPKTGH